MGRRRKQEGICKICGSYGPLSFEHVPPEAAFNDGRYYYTAQMEQILKLGDTDFDILSFTNKQYAQKKQGGIGFHSLCIGCNNNTGSWYGKSFVDWVYQSMAIILKASKNPTLYYPNYIFPLRIIKQVVAMFFSVNYDGFREVHPELVRFLLNKEEKYLPKSIRIYCYYNIEGANRYIGNNVVGSLNDMTPIHLSEITFPPLGFVMTIGAENAPDSRLTEISHFASYNYQEWIDHFQKFATLPTHLPFFPADYRSKEEIIQGMKESMSKKTGGQ
jgi:hypothetical protein